MQTRSYDFPIKIEPDYENDALSVEYETEAGGILRREISFQDVCSFICPQYSDGMVYLNIERYEGPEIEPYQIVVSCSTFIKDLFEAMRLLEAPSSICNLPLFKLLVEACKHAPNVETHLLACPAS